MNAVEVAAITPEVLELRNAYLQAGVLGERWLDDAAHVGVRTDAVLSAAKDDPCYYALSYEAMVEDDLF